MLIAQLQMGFDWRPALTSLFDSSAPIAYTLFVWTFRPAVTVRKLLKAVDWAAQSHWGAKNMSWYKWDTKKSTYGPLGESVDELIAEVGRSSCRETNWRKEKTWRRPIFHPLVKRTPTNRLSVASNLECTAGKTTQRTGQQTVSCLQKFFSRKSLHTLYYLF